MRSTVKKILDKIHPSHDKWKEECSFNSQEEYVKYIQSLSFSNQLKMAEAGFPVAQRLVAAHYLNNKKIDESIKWWEKAAANNDPLALLHEADVYRIGNHPQEALLLHAKALDAIKGSKDLEFKKFVLTTAQGILDLISSSYFTLGLEMYNKKDVASAKLLWKVAAELGDPAAAYNIAKIIKETHPKKALYYLNLALFLSQAPNVANPSNIRATAHNMIGTILADSLTSKSTFSDVKTVITHFRKAIAYGSDDTFYKENLHKVLGLIDERPLREALLLDTQPLEYSNGIYKTTSETFANPNMTKEQVENWLKYPDPRVETKELSAGKSSQTGVFATSKGPSSIVPEQQQRRATLG